MISPSFPTGFVLVNTVIVEYTLRLQKFWNTPHIFVSTVQENDFSTFYEYKCIGKHI